MKNSLLVLLLMVFFVGIIQQRTIAQVTFGTGTINVRVDDYGAIRIFTTEGVDTLQHINRISLIVAGNQGQVLEYWNDLGWVTETALNPNPTLSDFEVTGVYDNSFSGAPPDFLIEQSVYGWNNESYCLVKCILTNRETTAMPMQAGLDVVQYVDFTWEEDKIFYDLTNNILTQFENHYIGIKFLSEQTTSGQVFEWFDGYELLDTLYYNMMNAGTFSTDTLTTDADGGVGILGGEHSNIQPAATKTVYFAVAVGGNHNDMLANMQLALQKYNQLTSVESDLNNVPGDFVLEQNYPNPFNPSTQITFGLPERSDVVLKVFNALGEQVAELVNETLEAGTHHYNFDAANLSSGVYIYSMQTDGKMITKKMTVIK
ncbi:MAG: T9SS type A sorting domain-containing protein [Ignavibacteriales bacterium]|nr:MAG: T9SS type A sorting domain-containing protein [Ignavibacteriales bacterium]